MAAVNPNGEQNCNGSCRFNFYEGEPHILVPKVRKNMLRSIDKFCAAFYHTPLYVDSNDPGRTYPSAMRCLEQSSCKIYTGTRRGQNPKYSRPKTAVALVKFESEKGKILSVRRYTNCYEQEKHAEDFFKDDMNNWSKLHGLKKITLYITMQPCHKSTTGGTRGTRFKHSCCNTMIKLAKKHSSTNILIKPTHLSQAGSRKNGRLSPDGRSYDECIYNAEEGLENLMKVPNIEVSAMRNEDWSYLWSHVDHPERNKLDQVIREKLLDWEMPDITSLFIETD